MKIDRYDFWTNPARYWPREPLGSIFLGAAMLQAAPILLGEDDVLPIFTADWISSLPDYPSLASIDQIHFALRLLHLFKPETAARMEQEWMRLQYSSTGPLAGPGLVGMLSSPASLFDLDDWKLVSDAITARQNALYPKLQKRGEVTEWFARAVHDLGLVPMFACELDGGEMRAAEPSIWNVKWPGLEHVTENCSVRLSDPKNRELPRTHFLFLGRAAFEAALGSTNGQPDAAPGERLASIDDQEAAEAAAPASAPDGLRGKIYVALEALSDLYPHHMEGVSNDTRNADVNEWVAKHRSAVRSVSPRVISYALKRYKAGERIHCKTGQDAAK